MDIQTFIRLATAFSSLGGAVESQMAAVICDSEDMEEQNANALRACIPLLKALARENVEDAAYYAEQFASQYYAEQSASRMKL